MMGGFVPVLFAFALLNCCACQEIPVSQRISYGVDQLLINNVKSLQLVKAVEEMHSITNITYRNSEMCSVCNHVINHFIASRRNGATKSSLQTSMRRMCHLFTKWGQAACDGYINVEIDSVLYMIDNKNDLTGERACSIYLQQSGCVDPKREHWDIILPPREDYRVEQVDAGLKKVAATLNNDNVADINKVLHLTDFHYDPLYQPGNAAKCEFLLCCQKDSGAPKKPEDAAGFWGDYNVCDMPWHSVLDVLNHVKGQHPQIDYVYFTGDIISHRSWDTSVAGNTQDIKKMYAQFFNSFGKIPVYPILGNHEAHPTDFWSSSNVTSSKISTQWVFNLMSEEWSRWLPKDALETVKRGGFYTVLTKPGRRIIALNSNVCYTMNLWLLFKDKDPFGQLQWLADTLKQAETAGEDVHILSHVPPGSIECLMNWNEVFVKIVNRFSHIIKAQFNGHTHYDEFRVFYNKARTEVTNVAYNGGSFTTFVGFNPNYRVYDVDVKNYEVTDYEQWTYNMSEANLHQTINPNWYKLYSFKEAYGIPSMSLEDLGKLLKRMDGDNELMKKYYRFEVRDSDAVMKKGCNDKCLSAKLCAIKSVNFADSILCKDV